MADNANVRLRLWLWLVVAALCLSATGNASATVATAALGPLCGQKDVTAPNGVAFRILFANNGSVQRYEVTAKADDTEAVNDARLSLEQTYGPAGINAPPLRIIAFKPSPAGGGLMIPDRAIDSCGRTLVLH